MIKLAAKLASIVAIGNPDIGLKYKEKINLKTDPIPPPKKTKRIFTPSSFYTERH